MDYPFTTATDLAHAIATRQVSPVEVMRQCLERQATLEPVLNCFVTAMPEAALAAGAWIIGKTTTTEFGCRGGGPSPLSGITRNPWDLSKTPGGSSLGAASSVAAGVTPFALGTDRGGSVRLPSSFCGLFGIKAQFGRVPMFPVSATIGATLSA